jgi:HAD superfamily hydrolase (TIGR01509 family)
VAAPTLFDFNGVIVDDEEVHLAAMRELLAPFGVAVTDEEYTERYLGFDDAGAFRAILVDAGRAPSDDDVRALVLAKKPLYMEKIGTALRIFPGAAELVKRRAARGPVGIVSGALEHEIRYCLERLGVLDLVSFIVSAERCTACKPDPEGYVLAMRELGAAGARAVVVEDSLAGVQAAKAAGLRCVAVTHSYPRERLMEAGADAVADALAELTDALMEGPP